MNEKIFYLIVCTISFSLYLYIKPSIKRFKTHIKWFEIYKLWGKDKLYNWDILWKRYNKSMFYISILSFILLISTFFINNKLISNIRFIILIISFIIFIFYVRPIKLQDIQGNKNKK